MKLFICSMPILALAMVFNNICCHCEAKPISMIDPRAEAMFRAVKARHFQKAPQKRLVSAALNEYKSF